MKRLHRTYWEMIWKQYRRHRLGLLALAIVALFCLVGIYAPLFASSKPLLLKYEGRWYFPLFRYLFFTGFYTKYLDVFYNLLMLTLPIFIAVWFGLKLWHQTRFLLLGLLLLFQCGFFIYLVFRQQDDPASSVELNRAKQKELQAYLTAHQADPLRTPPLLPDWNRELEYLTPYARLNIILQYQVRFKQDQRLQAYQKAYAAKAASRGKTDLAIPSLWHFDRLREQEELDRQQQTIAALQNEYPENKRMIDRFAGTPTQLSQSEQSAWMKAKSNVDRYEIAQARIKYIEDKNKWIHQQLDQIHDELMPLVRPFHWEDDAGGEQELNQYISWWDLTRINRKDMVAALIFGIRISLSVGLLAIALALLIGIPLGAVAGYYGGKMDIILFRLIEVWESMPTFFMLLMVVAFLQSKSIFLVIGVIGFFGWTNFSRFIRGEFFKQKQLPYVEACHAMGYSNSRIMFVHLLPNAIPPLLTLVPFAVMGAITSEAGLSFLGLGEEGSSSWGVLMDEGRSAFPSESYLLWPPAILLTLLLVSIAIVGDTFRDALDPKMHY